MCVCVVRECVRVHNLPDNKFIVQPLSFNPPVNVDKATSKLYSEVVIHFIYLLSKIYFKTLLSK